MTREEFGDRLIRLFSAPYPPRRHRMVYDAIDLLVPLVGGIIITASLLWLIWGP